MTKDEMDEALGRVVVWTTDYCEQVKVRVYRKNPGLNDTRHWVEVVEQGKKADGSAGAYPPGLNFSLDLARDDVRYPWPTSVIWKVEARCNRWTANLVEKIFGLFP